MRSNAVTGLELGLFDSIQTGGRYGIFWNTSRSRSNSTQQTLNPAYRSNVTLNMTQPLLEGRGATVNRAPIMIARNNQSISVLQLRSQLIDTLSRVQNTYWELVFALESLKVQQLALEQAGDLLRVNQQLKEAGKASLSDILQAKAAVAARQASVIAARDEVEDAEDNLKRITNLIADESVWEKPLIPSDVPSLEAVEADLQESLITAIQNRPEYSQAKLDLQNSEIALKVVNNGRLPTLDLEASLGLNGLGGDLDDPFSQVGTADYRSWSIALAFQTPLGRRTKQAELKKQHLENQQKLLTLKDLEQQIITEVRGAVRQLGTDSERIRATQAAEELAKQVLSTEERKHQLDLVTSYDLLQFQASLATATKNRLSAVIDYRKSIVALNQVLGITLDTLGIQFEQ